MKPPRSDRPRGARPGGKPFQKADRPQGAGGPGRSGGGDRPFGRPAAKKGPGGSYASRAEKPRGTDFRGSDSRGADFRGTDARGTDARGPKGRGAESRGAENRFQDKRTPDRTPYRGPREDHAPGGRTPGGRTSEGRTPGDRTPSRPPRDRAERPEAAFRERPVREREHTQEAGDAPRGPRPGGDAPRGAVWLYGLHAVQAALANPERRFRRLVVTEEGAAQLTQRLRRSWPIEPEITDRTRLDQILGRDAVHQGIALLCDLLPQLTVEEALERTGPVLVLDQVTDPRNIGAILRSAAAFGAACVILQDRHAPEETGSLAKAASGALETVPLLRAVNLARTIGQLKAANCWTVGLDAEATQALSGPSFAGRRVALVLGAEGEGLRRLTRESCDELAMLPMPGEMESLNVSAATAVALYELTCKA